MLEKNLFAVVSAAVVSSIAIAGSAEAASMFRVDLDAANPNNQQTVNLAAGDYKVELLGIADGGLYDAWSLRPSTTCPSVCNQTRPITFTGWLQNFSIESSDITSISNAFNIGTGKYLATDSKVYNTAAAANAAFKPVLFSLGANSNVNFEILDDPYIDNRGGLSLKISRVSEPVPEPASTLSLLVLGILGAGSIRGRKYRKGA
ncbi:MAG: PEP-CTERM sorting domain-containing protein [Cyanobacteriota bacterium]|nr:PEP-CTERM sorting domain-containing protein [Cyanobacteriota bacterium]